MSIIFDFKAIRQDAAAIGIRTIGEDNLPQAAPEQQQDSEPVNSTPCKVSTGPSAAAGAPIKSRDFFRGPVHGAGVSGGLGTNQAQQAADLRGPGHITYAPSKPPLELLLAPVTIEDLLRLSDKEFAKLLSRIDTGRLKHLLDPDEEGEVDVDDEDDDAPEDDEDDDI